MATKAVRIARRQRLVWWLRIAGWPTHQIALWLGISSTMVRRDTKAAAARGGDAS
jgi:DNA-binding transcriptional regulator LsrR (DeoR family)